MRNRHQRWGNVNQRHNLNFCIKITNFFRASIFLNVSDFQPRIILKGVTLPKTLGLHSTLC